jgi:signal transduction histidine kinase
LRQASQGMTLIKELDRLLNLIVHTLTMKAPLTYAAIYLWDEKSNRFILKTARQWEKANDAPTFGEEDPLIAYIKAHQEPIVTEELLFKSKDHANSIAQVAAQLKALEASVLIPGFVEGRCLGFLILGAKKSGALYTPDDLHVLQLLANQAALAIENAQFYEELKATQADLYQAQKMVDLGRMAGAMSHQVNNRFHALTLLGGVLRDYLKNIDPTTIPKDELMTLWTKILDTLTKVENNALQGGDIVKSILRFGRSPKGGELNLVPLKLSQIISATWEVAQHLVDMNQFDRTQEIPEDLPPIAGDLNLLSDSLRNLLTNAYDAIQNKADLIQKNQLPPSPSDPTPYRGHIRLVGRTEETQDKRWVVLDVQDNGIGMTPHQLECLFIPFFTTKATSQKGTGLGLYVIRRIIERHGGTIGATSTYGVGTTFTIRLPALEKTDA